VAEAAVRLAALHRASWCSSWFPAAELQVGCAEYDVPRHGPGILESDQLIVSGWPSRELPLEASHP
jgi:hypothetical protein